MPIDTGPETKKGRTKSAVIIGRRCLPGILTFCFFFPGLAVAAGLPATRLNKKDGSLMMLVPAGEFVMGTDKPYYNDEKPAHKVYLDAFYIDKHEITNAQYFKFVQATNHRIPAHTSDPEFDIWSKAGFPAGLDNYPVVDVSWQDADSYCKWAGKRLATEAEWEKAARGIDERLYPWGNQPPESINIPFGRQWDGNRTYQPVGSKPQGFSAYGALDMAGNVAEWVADWYDPGYYKYSPNKNPTGPETGFYKVVRGGSVLNVKFYLRCIDRDFDDTGNSPKEVGISCVTVK